MCGGSRRTGGSWRILSLSEVNLVFKLFSLEGATRMLPIVDARLAELQLALSDLEEVQARTTNVRQGSAEALSVRQELAFVLNAAHGARREVERLGVQVHDLSTGVVEFPSRVDGEVVHLVWHRGQDAITAYHRLTEDDETRPLAHATSSADESPKHGSESPGA
jgi:hypothetical protein